MKCFETFKKFKSMCHWQRAPSWGNPCLWISCGTNSWYVGLLMPGYCEMHWALFVNLIAYSSTIMVMWRQGAWGWRVCCVVFSPGSSAAGDRSCALTATDQGSVRPKWRCTHAASVNVTRCWWHKCHAEWRPQGCHTAASAVTTGGCPIHILV